MKQALLVPGGGVEVMDVPAPVLQPDGVLVGLAASVISSGTERAKLQIHEESLLGKARARPDLVRKVAEQARRDGVIETVRLVRDRLASPQPIGYSASGVVIAAGDRSTGFTPGQMVAVGGAGFANHAEIVYVPARLAAVVPQGVTAESAAFTTIAAIAMHGLRQAELSPGDLVAVSGLGLVGQLAVRLLMAYGHPVVGVDPDPAARAEVASLGIATMDPEDVSLESVGADAVLLCASTESSGPIQAAASWCRDRGTVVVVGAVGLQVDRAPYYDKEVQIRFSRSYGPGRYDPEYEERGHDYPIGYVRWTEQRNFKEVMRLIASGLVRVDDLISARFRIDEASSAYRMLDTERVRAIVLAYDEFDTTAGPIPLRTPTAVTRKNSLRINVCGAGNFARKVLIPALDEMDGITWGAVTSGTGVSAAAVGAKLGFLEASSDSIAVAADPLADAVVIATRHDSHAALAAAAANAESAVFVEKPLALSEEELRDLQGTSGHDRIVTGFNRRFAPATKATIQAMAGGKGPAVINIVVNAGKLDGHWSDTAEQGGRIIGEVCHFVDLACFLVGAPAIGVLAVGAGRRRPSTEDQLAASIRFGDGSFATIAYFPVGSPRFPKERVEIHRAGMTAVIEDFRTWRFHAGGRPRARREKRQDKGHRALLSAFVGFARGERDSPVPFHQAAHVMRATFGVVESLATGQTVSLSEAQW